MATSYFSRPDNIANIIRSISETGILALGMTFVIIAAGIDLSVGAVLGLCSVLTADLLVNEGWGLWSTLPLVLVTGFVFGAVQGAISTKFRIQAFIVTLAGLQAARGLSLIASNNSFININYGAGPGSAPPAFAVLGERIGGVFPVATLVFVALAAVATFVLNNTRYGRYVFAVGGNEKAARLSGIPVEGIKVSVYAITGLASAVAGIVHAGQFSFGSPNDGTGYELNAIAAVVIGGTDSFRGRRQHGGHHRGCGDAGRTRQYPGAQRRECGHAAAGHRRHHRVGGGAPNLCGPRRRRRALTDNRMSRPGSPGGWHEGENR